MSKPGKMAQQLIKSLFKKPATINYPAQKSEMAEGFRGKLKFKAHLCIGCKLCMRDCPTDAIVIRKVGEKKFEAEIDIAKCISCAQCVDSCPANALDITPEFELARLDRMKLKVLFSADTDDDTKEKT